MRTGRSLLQVVDHRDVGLRRWRGEPPGYGPLGLNPGYNCGMTLDDDQNFGLSAAVL